jgi:bacteriocin-like protein
MIRRRLTQATSLEVATELTDEQLDSINGGNGGLFEIEDYSFDIEQTLSIGSQSTGAGAGKVKF